MIYIMDKSSTYSINFSVILNFIYLVVVLPVLFLFTKDAVPGEYKKYIMYCILLLASMHVYMLFTGSVEHMEVCGVKIHELTLVDSCPGYDTPCLNIKKGDVVKWTNVGELRHSVTEKNSKFNSGYLYPGESYSIRLNKVGVYEYYCMLHTGWMVGRINVM